jgi:hypothetical protein
MRTNLRRFLILGLLIVGDPTPESLIAGAVLVLLGQALHFVAAGLLVKTDVLTTAGPYRFVRNPFYVANFLTDAGFCVVAWTPWLPLAWMPAFYLFVVHPRVLAEEAELLEIHGRAYQDYLDRVPRYLPSPFARYPHVRGAWSLGPLIRNREIPRQLRHGAFVLAFFALDRVLDAQGGDRWAPEGYRLFLQQGPAAYAFWAAMAMVVAPWVPKLLRRIRCSPPAPASGPAAFPDPRDSGPCAAAQPAEPAPGTGASEPHDG